MDMFRHFEKFAEQSFVVKVCCARLVEKVSVEFDLLFKRVKQVAWGRRILLPRKHFPKGSLISLQLVSERQKDICEPLPPVCVLKSVLFEDCNLRFVGLDEVSHLRCLSVHTACKAPDLRSPSTRLLSFPQL